MPGLIDKHIIKIQVTVAIGFVVSVGFFIYRLSAFAFLTENTEQRVTKIEVKMDDLATKDDIDRLKVDLKDYINKK